MQPALNLLLDGDPRMFVLFNRSRDPDHIDVLLLGQRYDPRAAPMAFDKFGMMLLGEPHYYLEE